MKKYTPLIFFLLGIYRIVNAQNPVIDSVRRELAIKTQDTTEVNLLNRLCNYHKWRRPDSTLFYGNKALVLARKINYKKGEVNVMSNMARAQHNLGNHAAALQINLQASKIAERHHLILEKSILLMELGSLYRQSENYSMALTLHRESKILFDSLGDPFLSIIAQTNVGHTFMEMNQMDSALYYTRLANASAEKLESKGAIQWVQNVLGKVYHRKGEYEQALVYFQNVLKLTQIPDLLFECNYSIAQVYQQLEKVDSSIYYAKKSLDVARQGGFILNIIEANILLSGVYANIDPVQSLNYSTSAITYKDRLDYLRSKSSFEAYIDFDEQERQYELETAKAAYNSKAQRLWIFSISGALISAIILALVLYQNNKNKQKANAVLNHQKEEIERQKTNVESALSNLKSTQSQLIQSEKMASLGELTAGIAHEIQNPLNFVNNFSEVSGELIDEMQDELNMNNPDVVREIAVDLKQNLDKINHHGQRASGIVKGMLEHSRTSTGQKELTDINAMADEYLRLAYHGLRAKDKSFNVDFKADLDESLPKINIITQDIGRVLLNLINNAFYAASSRVLATEDSDYKPMVEVSTKKLNDKIEISVKDNGPGIPEEIKDKIFQPFFTTKPTGSGTGLGLSLSYDIVKAHGGELKVETKEGKGADFFIILPI